MDLLIRLLTDYGLLFVFVNVLVEQLGAPLPAYPMLLVTGALASRGELPLISLLAVAITACLLADTVWYFIGRWMGRRVLRLLCRISLSPDSCVRQTESIFTRFGAASLTVAKFVPGFASVATALAGAMNVPRGQFLLFDILGSLLWVGVALTLGWVFSPVIEDLVSVLATLGKGGLLLLAVMLVLFIASKWWQRHRFNQQLRMARFSAEALAELLDRGERPLIVDVRSPATSQLGHIPGAVASYAGTSPPALNAYPKDAPVIVYCACPNDASAVMVARRLLAQGFLDVRPLAGGFDAWVATGRAVEN